MSKRILWLRMATQDATLIDIAADDPRIPFVTSLLAVIATRQQPALVFGVGPLGGLRGAGLAEAVVAGTSPHSGGVTEARIQGRLASALRSAGLDAIVVTDPATQPAVVTVAESGAGQFTAAMDTNSTWEITDKCRSSHPEAVVAAIGGRSPLASIVVDKGIATAIGGLGVTMADLGLQALVLPWREPGTDRVIDAITARYARDIDANPLTTSERDAPGFGVWLTAELAGYLAGGDFAPTLPDQVRDFRAESALPLLIDLGTNACPGCPQQCLKSYGPLDPDGGRLHQQSLAAFIAGFGDTDVHRALEFNAVCHELGLEHLAVAACLRSIGWSTEMPVRDQVEAVQHMSIPSDAMTVKGMPLSPWDPRGSQGLAVGFALSPIGPHYDTLEHDIDFDPAWVWPRHVQYGEEFGVPAGGLPVGTLPDERFASLFELLTLWSGMTAMGVCIYAGPPTRELRLADVLAMTASVTGVSLTREEFLDMGRRRLALLRRVNSVLGMTSDADDLPAKFFTEPTANGDLGFPNVAIDRVQFERARDYLVERLGWAPAGGVREATATELESFMALMDSALQI